MNWFATRHVSAKHMVIEGHCVFDKGALTTECAVWTLYQQAALSS
jgi:hypothetical protein